MSSATRMTYRADELTFEQQLQAAYDKGRREEREVIRREVQSKGYDWSHDRNTSGVQNVLNWLDERTRSGL